MPFLASDETREPARIQWLIRLRWVAVLGVLAVVLATGPLLGIIDDVRPLLALVTALAVWNSVLVARLRRRVPVQGAGSQVATDLLLLAGLLFFSGGVRNPFAVFLVVQVILGGILLPRRTAYALAGLAAVLTVVLTALDLAGVLPLPEAALDRGPLRDGMLAPWGIELALLITMLVAVNFTVRLMEDLRARAEESVRYHEEAARERAKLLDVVRSVGAGMALLDGAHRLSWANRRAAAVLGEPAPGTPFALDGLEGWPPREELAAGRTLARDWKGRDAQGRPRRYQVSAAPVLGAGGRLEQVIVLLVDVTELRAAEEQLVRAEKMAALGRLAAGVAHEIATPLGSVSILTAEAQECLPRAFEGDPEARRDIEEALGDIRSETRRMTALVRRLLDLSHPGDDRPSPTDPSAIAEEAVRLSAVRAGKARHRLRFEPGEPLPPVPAVPTRLLQVLLNVLDNALDATEANQGAVVVRTLRAGDRAVIEVEDEGEGIPAEHMDLIFDPFFTTKEAGKGTGLGLYVSYEIMKNLGGAIDVRSAPGAGTRIRLLLPIAAPEARPAAPVPP